MKTTLIPIKGGPQTESGKAKSSRNAVTHGVFREWFDETEQATFEHWRDQLLGEYGHVGPTTKLLVERAAQMMVRLERVRKAEDALYQKARLVRAHHESQSHAGSISSMLPQDEESGQRALQIATAAATPDIAALDAMLRYDTSFDRQLFKCLQALKVLKDDHLPSADQPAVRSSAVVVPLPRQPRRN
jgi:hypothetical protein